MKPARVSLRCTTVTAATAAQQHTEQPGPVEPITPVVKEAKPQTKTRPAAATPAAKAAPADVVNGARPLLTMAMCGIPAPSFGVWGSSDSDSD